MQRLGLMLLVACLGGGTQAGEGRTPVYESPATLSASGRYVLTRDLAAAAGQPTITISGADVDLDLNGYTVHAASVVDSIRIEGTVNQLRIANGTLRGAGISRFAGAPGLNLAVIEDLRILDAFDVAIGIDQVRSVSIRRNVVDGADGGGFDLKDAGGGLSGAIEDNVIKGTGLRAINVSEGNGLRIVGNQLQNIGTGFPEPGMRVAGVSFLIERNTIELVSGFGIDVRGPGVVVRDNEIYNATDAGIRSSGAATLVFGNTVTQTAGGPGILFEVGGDGGAVRENLLYRNDDVGLRLGSTAVDNAYAGNVARFNCRAGPCPCGAGTATEICDDGANLDGGDNFMP